MKFPTCNRRAPAAPYYAALHSMNGGPEGRSENYMELQIQHKLQFTPAPALFTATEAETKKEEKDAANKHRNKENELN